MVAIVIANRRVPIPDQERKNRWKSLTLEVLLKVISDEWDRAKALEEKLVKTTAALSISGAVGGVASRSLVDGLAESSSKMIVMILLVFSIFSLFSGVCLGFKGLRPKPRGGVGPDFAVSVREDSHDARDACVKALSLFEVSNIRLANEASGANSAIRNGILSFGLASFVIIFAPRVNVDARPSRVKVEILAPVVQVAVEPTSVRLDSSAAPNKDK